MRRRYVGKLLELLPVDAMQFVNTLEYEPDQGQPPFSVTPAEVSSYYGATHDVDHLEDPLVPDHGLVRAWGLTYVREHFFRLQRRN